MVYLGGKQKTAKYIVPILQEYIDKNNIETYIEPFVGGANIIDKISCQNKYGIDISEPLIALHRFAQTHHNTNDYPIDITREYYNRTREDWKNDNGACSEREIGIVGYLGSMNGRFFDGGYAKPMYKNGELYRNFYWQHRDNLLKQSISQLYQDIDFICDDYRSINPYNALIYCDPPYKGKKEYGISKNFNHDEFWNWVREKSQDNIVIVSELEAPNDFKPIWSKSVKRTVKPSDGILAVEKLYILCRYENEL